MILCDGGVKIKCTHMCIALTAYGAELCTAAVLPRTLTVPSSRLNCISRLNYRYIRLHYHICLISMRIFDCEKIKVCLYSSYLSATALGDSPCSQLEWGVKARLCEIGNIVR